MILLSCETIVQATTLGFWGELEGEFKTIFCSTWGRVEEGEVWGDIVE